MCQQRDCQHYEVQQVQHYEEKTYVRIIHSCICSRKRFPAAVHSIKIGLQAIGFAFYNLVFILFACDTQLRVIRLNERC